MNSLADSEEQRKELVQSGSETNSQIGFFFNLLLSKASLNVVFEKIKYKAEKKFGTKALRSFNCSKSRPLRTATAPIREFRIDPIMSLFQSMNILTFSGQNRQIKLEKIDPCGFVLYIIYNKIFSKSLLQVKSKERVRRGFRCDSLQHRIVQ